MEVVGYRTHTLLDSLTAIQVDKQDQVITLLHQLTANTDELEINTDELEVVGYRTNTLLDSLTGIQVDKQDQVITLLHNLTGKILQVDLNTDSLEINTDGLEGLLIDTNLFLNTLTGVGSDLSNQQQTTNSLLDTLTASNQKIAGFSIPPYDEIAVSYLLPTNNISTVTYLNISTIVLSLSFTYAQHPPTIDDELVINIKKI